MKLKLASLLLFMLACAKKEYVKVLQINEQGYSIEILSPTGEIRKGENELLLRIEPKPETLEGYFYMPPMPGMPEMRRELRISESDDGFKAKVNVDMNGNWQIVLLLDGKEVRKEIVIPTSGSMDMEHAQHMDMQHMEHAKDANLVRIPTVKLQKINVSTFVVKDTTVSKSILVEGYITFPNEEVFKVAPRFSGYVVKLMKSLEGTYVSKGEPLFSFYSPEVLRTKEEYEHATEKLKKEILRKLEYLQLRVKDIQDEKAIFRSPVSGYLKRIYVRDGSSFSKGQVIFEIVSTTRAWFIANVPLSQVRFVSVGDKVVVGKAEGRVISIHTDANPKTRTVEVKVLLTGDRFYEGTFAIGKVVKSVKGIFVPRDAVIRSGKMDYVFVEKAKGLYELVMVNIITDTDDGYIVEGLKEGDRVVQRGVFLIDAEAKLSGGMQAHSH